MNDLPWKEQYKEWKADLKPFQIKLLDEGAESLSQSWLLNEMWCDWNTLKRLKEANLPSIQTSFKQLTKDPWDEDP